MSAADWAVLGLTLLFVVAYGTYKSRGSRTIDGYLVGNRSLPWYHVCLSVMATQASAITFLSAPGLAYATGMSFVQFYLGLPLAMIVLSITFVPIFHKLRVFTAYEFLEERFDLKTRALTAILFLIQRGLSTGITIYAPSIILSVILNISTVYTTLFIGGLVLVYTIYGGTKAVSYTQLLQMAVIFSGLFIAGVLTVKLLPANVGFVKAIHLAGKMGRTNAADFSFDWNNPYTVWSGLIGGFFLQLSYFGTDQSQVGRYLTGASIGHSRLGLLMNGLVKIPMQFLILLIGVLIFSFYQYHPSPVFFNRYELSKLEKSDYAGELGSLKEEQRKLGQTKAQYAGQLADALDKNDRAGAAFFSSRLKETETVAAGIRAKLTDLMQKNDPEADINDTNYVFLSFVTQYLPRGLIGLLVAIIFLASMGSTASALNSLASTTIVDVYKRMMAKTQSDDQYVRASRIATFGWGVVCIVMALYASKLGNLIEAVNKLGSLFYGTILGIFVVAFYIKRVNGNTVFTAALLTEGIIVAVWKFTGIAFLWLNVIGCILVVLLSLAIYLMKRKSGIMPGKVTG
jgi:Na+/proline symporter